MRYYVQKSLG